MSPPVDWLSFKDKLKAIEAARDSVEAFLARKPIDWSQVGRDYEASCETKSESPIEEKMRQALVKVLPGSASVEQQKPLCGGVYRVDFAITTPEGAKVVVECDGHDFHEKTKEQAARDRKRDRELQLAGWMVLRFTGSEIWRGAENCARDVARALELR